jgi:hypothetical protein
LDFPRVISIVFTPVDSRLFIFLIPFLSLML